MRQISLRQEAGRLGGIGVCGRELCCSTWLVDFKNVTTSAARYQNLSLNPGKLSGQCGRLKCCLNYELDTYMDAIKDIPHVDKPLQTESGHAKLQKTDIFRKLMWFSYNNDNDWHSITCERVREIQALNESGIKVFNLQVDKSTDIEDLAAQSTRELELLDKKFAKKKKKKKSKPRPQGDFQATETAPKAPQQPRPSAPKPQGQRPQGQRPQGPKPQGSRPSNRQNPASTNPPQAKVQAAQVQGKPELNEGSDPRKRKNKNRNRPKPAQNQNAGNKPESQNPSPRPENQESKPGEGKRRFPQRKNQGPNNGGNE